MEPLHPTKEDNILERLAAIEAKLANLGQKVQYQDKPDALEVLSPNGFVTRNGTLLGASVVMTPNGPDIVFIIKGEGNRIAGMSAQGVKFID